MHWNAMGILKSSCEALYRVGRLSIFAFAFTLTLTLALGLFPGCALVPEPKAVQWNSSPDWRSYQGQAVWVTEKDGPEIAADLVLAIGPEEQVWVQLSKTPFTLWTFQRSADPEVWKIEIPGKGASWIGRGKGPDRFIGVALAKAWMSGQAPKGWEGSGWAEAAENLSREGMAEWSISHPKSGQRLEGYLEDLGIRN